MSAYLFQMSGLEASHAKTSLLREWANGKDLRGTDLDFFMTLLDLLEKHAPEFLLSKTCRVSAAPTEEGTFPSSLKRWPNSGMLLDGVLLTADTLESPNQEKESTLSGVIETGQVPLEYF